MEEHEQNSGDAFTFSPDEGFTRAVMPGDRSCSWSVAGWGHLPRAAPLLSSAAARRARRKRRRGPVCPSAGRLLLSGAAL